MMRWSYSRKKSFLSIALVLTTMTGSSTSVIRKRITVIASREVSDDGVEMITSILPRRFAVKFKILKTGTLTYSICSEVAQAITTYSSMEGETLVLLIPDHAPLPSCQNRHNGSVIFTRRKTHNTFRYGSISGRRNLDKIGSKEEVLEYLDMITTAKDLLPGEALRQEDNPSRGHSITFFVMVFLMLTLLIAIAVLLVQCIRLRKAKRMSLRKIQRIGYSVDSNRDEKEVQEKLDRTQDTDGDSVTAIELKSEERISAETPRDETPLAKTPGSHLKDANASAEFFVKAEAARSLTEVLVMPVSANEFIRYLQMVARFTIEWSDNPVKCSVTSDDLPGTLYNTIPLRAPETPDTFEELLHDIKCKIITNEVRPFRIAFI